MTTAYVLTGGGSLGAVQVGMLQALAERGRAPDLLVGTSAGAVNAAFVAGHGSSLAALDQLAALWSGLRRRDVYPLDLRRQLAGLAGSRPSLFSSAGLAALLRRHLPYARLEDAAIPVHVVTTDLLSGEEVVLSRGDAVSAVLASTAIPGLHPAVERDGSWLVDGGLADNAAISQAVLLGATEVYVLPTGYACALTAPPRRPLAVALHALSFLTQQRLVHDVGAFAQSLDLHVIPPPCPLDTSPADFRQGRRLVDRARQETGAWLDGGGDRLPHPARFLSLHHHGPHRPTLLEECGR